MKINSFYPVITTKKLNESKNFYAAYLGFKVTFDSDWYISMASRQGPVFELALLDYTHPSLPEAFQHPTQGMLLNVEVENVDSEYKRLSSLGADVVLDIRSEYWGQRHFIIQDPNGILIDLIQNIEVKESFKEQYK
jgi:catechol 2,3-dioxygenase-like lactoylglutathione lyase family enzyme